MTAAFIYLIKQVELAIRGHLDAIVAPEGITAAQYTALTVLERHPGMTAAELARSSFVRPQSVAQMVTGLENVGYLHRNRDGDHRRQFRMTLTDDGARLLDRLRGQVSRIEDAMVVGLDEPTRDAFHRALVVARGALEAEPAAPAGIR